MTGWRGRRRPGPRCAAPLRDWFAYTEAVTLDLGRVRDGPECGAVAGAS